MILEKIFEGYGKKVLKVVIYSAIGVFLIVDFIIPREHVIFPWDSIPAFSAGYGFISTLIIIIVSKLLGKFWLQKKEDYYD